MTDPTPGPWYLGEIPMKEFVQGPDGVEEWGIYPEPQNIDAEQTLIGIAFKPANARLIAAAPELLAALEAALPELASDARHDDSVKDIHAQVVAAIAKARGQ